MAQKGERFRSLKNRVIYELVEIKEDKQKNKQYHLLGLGRMITEEELNNDFTPLHIKDIKEDGDSNVSV